MHIHLVIAGYVILTTIEIVVSQAVLESLQMLLQVTTAIIGNANPAIKELGMFVKKN